MVLSTIHEWLIVKLNGYLYVGVLWRIFKIFKIGEWVSIGGGSKLFGSFYPIWGMTTQVDSMFVLICWNHHFV